jgi:aromatic-amino-acid transaminase
MLGALNAAPAGTVVVLHACCHNPTGYDITPSSGTQVVRGGQGTRPGAFLDMAYQGFGEGIAEDGAVIGQFMGAGLDFFVATSSRRASRCTANASAR